jgi:biopolymer transport protein ExbD
MIRKKRIPVGEIPLCSLADISFLILTFFLVSTVIYADKGIPLALPMYGDQMNVPKKNICNVFINDVGLIMVSETVMPIALLKENIRQRIIENPDLIISIKSVKDTPYKTFIDVLSEIKLSGAGKISIAEMEK